MQYGVEAHQSRGEPGVEVEVGNVAPLTITDGARRIGSPVLSVAPGARGTGKTVL